MSTDGKNDLTSLDFDGKWHCCYRQTTDHITDFIDALSSNDPDVTRPWSSVELPHIAELVMQDNHHTHDSYNWWYRKQFDWILSDQQQEHQVYLMFESSTKEYDANTSAISATIWLNGQEILSNSLVTERKPIELSHKLLRSCQTLEKNKHNNILIISCMNTSLSLHARLIIQGTVIWALGQVKTDDPIIQNNHGSNLRRESSSLDYAVRVNDADRRIGVVFNDSEEEYEPSLLSSSSIKSPIESVNSKIQISEKKENLHDVPVPRLTIAILIVGTRGDVQPFIALGQALLQVGHRVRLATHETFRSFVRENSLEFFPLAGDPADLISFMVKNAGIIPSMSSIVAGDIAKKRHILTEILASTWLACTANDDETLLPFTAEAIIANPPSFGHVHCAEKLQIPLHIMFTMPWTPTSAFPHPLCNIDNSRGSTGKINFYSYHVFEMLTWSGMRGIVNHFRKKVLGLAPLHAQQATNALTDERVPHTYCWSPSLVTKPSDWESHIDVSGYFFLDLSTSYTNPPHALLDFLGISNDHSNQPTLPLPIYIGFGSITGHDSQRLLAIVIDALNRTGYRALLSGLATETDHLPENIFKIGNVPHDWLFQHVSAVCHHGGAGTTAAGLRAGKPTIIVPFFGDQFFWGNIIEKSGAGPRSLPGKSVTALELAEAFRFAHQPTTRQAAERIRVAILEENGCQTAVRAFHANLPTARMRSDLEPTFAACYRIDKHDLQISRPVAHVLVAADAIDVLQLRSHPIRKWQFKHDHQYDGAPCDTSENTIKSRAYAQNASDGHTKLVNSNSTSNLTMNVRDDTKYVHNNLQQNKSNLSIHSTLSSGTTNHVPETFLSLSDAHSDPKIMHEIDVTDSKTRIKTTVSSICHHRKAGLINFLKRSRIGYQEQAISSTTADALIGTTKCAIQPAVCSLPSPAPWFGGPSQNIVKAVGQTDEINERHSQTTTFEWTSESSISSNEQKQRDSHSISAPIKVAASLSGFHPDICQQILREFEQIKIRQEQALTITSTPSRKHSQHKFHFRRQRSHSTSAIDRTSQLSLL